MNQREKVLNVLNELKIDYEIIEHPAVKTMEEINELKIDKNSEVLKNLFLYDDRKKRFFVVSIIGNKTINLKNLKDKLSSRPLSFASEERLKLILELEKGAVSPLGILNDKEEKVEVVFDKEIKSLKKVGVHPNDNTATIFLSPNDLEKVIKANCENFCYINLED